MIGMAKTVPALLLLYFLVMRWPIMQSWIDLYPNRGPRATRERQHRACNAGAERGDGRGAGGGARGVGDDVDQRAAGGTAPTVGAGKRSIMTFTSAGLREAAARASAAGRSAAPKVHTGASSC